jgi:hypothetical protein
MYTRVYDPINSEPFDVPNALATKLRLEDGWSSTPFTVAPKAVEPAPSYPASRASNVQDALPEAPEASEKD